jgi:L-ascorbate metabolism protein UlaG (beta-lactamase superfamily)
MDMLNTGHLGFAIREGDFTLRVDPLLPVNGCFGPARYAAESQLPPADCIAVTSPHPFNSSGASLRELAGEAPVIGSRSCVASLRGVERKRLHELPADATVSLGPVQLTSLPGSNGDTLLLSNGEDSLWLLGPSAVSISTALAAFARTGKGRARVVLSGYLDCPSEVACGGARNFPERAHQQLLDTARALRIAGFSKLLVAGGVRFRGTSDGLNAFAEAPSIPR